MAYVKTEWKAREGTNLNKFTKSEETAESVILTNTPDLITEPGTPFSTDNMNHIERGIAGAHELIANEAVTREEGEGALTRNIASAHEDIRGAIAEEALQRKEADKSLSDRIGALSPEGMGDLPALLAQKADKTDLAGLAPLNSPKFTGTVTVPSKATAATNSSTLVASEAQVYQKADITALKDKKTATFIIGISAAGHTPADVDYLCDNTNNHSMIASAIAALPDGGGKIIIREGTYKLDKPVHINRDNIVIEGMGASTVLMPVSNIYGDTEGLLIVSKSYCKVANLTIGGDFNSYDLINGILITGANNSIKYNIVRNLNGDSSFFCRGICIKSGHNLIRNNIIGNTLYNRGAGTGSTGCVGILVDGNYADNYIAGNTIRSRIEGMYFSGTLSGISSSGLRTFITSNKILIEDGSSGGNSSCGISVSGSSCTVSGNTVGNSGGADNGSLRGYGYGIAIYGKRNVVSYNVIYNKKSSGQTSSSTAAFYIHSNATFCTILGNNARNVVHANDSASFTGAVWYNGSAYSTSHPAGSATTAGATSTGDNVVGFTII
jgi:hypothetical protein